jgi:hypothetical protein
LISKSLFSYSVEESGEEYLNMAKATIRTSQGLQVKVEGTPAEITALVKDLERQSGSQAPAPRRRKAKPGRVLLVDLVGSLRDGGFFKKPRDLGSIRAALAEMGHHYPVTTLSPAMLRKVRSKEIRRIREQKRWLYVQ